MIFTSTRFLVFFAIVFALYWRLPHRAQNRFLVVASLVFYGSWDWRFLSLIGACAGVNYVAALRIPGSRRPDGWVALAAAVSLGILAVFKYFDFFVENVRWLLGSPGGFDAWNVILPVGISFYTFQALSYVIDVRRGSTRPRSDFGDFLLYVAFFPQLVAGPIERAARLLPQIEAPRRWDPAAIREGLALCLVGWWQKTVIADPLAAIADPVFADPAAASPAALWVALYAFALQIYCDFSGYSKIARGCARLLGFELMVNFRQPYFSAGPREFWRRWHVSLSTWLRDYVYIPLGGNRRGRRRTAINLMLTMLLGGLWHGAAWTFVVWGGLHGLYLALERALPGRAAPPSRAGRALRTALTFQLVAFTWIFFRAADFAAAAAFFRGLFAIGGSFEPAWTTLLLAAPALLAVDALLERLERAEPPAWLTAHRHAGAGLVAAALFATLVLVGIPRAKPFIYFQF